MNALTSANIRHAEFVRLTTKTSTLTFCNAAAPITVSGITFSNVGALLSVGDIPQDIKATSDDITLALTGIDPTYISLVFSQNLKGSQVEIWRGFFDSNNQIITTPTTQFFKRYTGIVNSMALTEDFNQEARQRVATVTLACTSMRKVLENRIAALRTNKASWQVFYPSDTSMNRVAEISNTFFDFGKPPIVQSSSSEIDAPNNLESPGA
jgi:hypothetical protein